MKGRDRFLLLIIAAIVLLVVAAFVVVLSQPEAEYRDGNAPEDVVHNYLLALREHKYDLAYSYLSPTLPGYPEDVVEFEEDIDDSYRFSWNRDVALDVYRSSIRGQQATVEVSETTFDSGGILDSGQYTHRFEMELRFLDGEWKLVDADSFWTSCWNQSRMSTKYCW